MKYNQYAYVKTDHEQEVKELIDINFLPRNYEDWSFSDLLAKLVKMTLAEAKSDEAKTAKLAEFAVTESQTLADFLADKPEKIGTNEFYNVALQLLGYHVHYDYDLADPTAFMQRNALPVVKDITNVAQLITAFYRLLNTRSKNGQILLDVMAGKGYFTQFWGQNKFMFFNGKALPVFDTNKVIREVVYVETDLDTDQDGKSDLVQVTIFRPRETTAGLKVPALYTASPYFGGIIANEKRNHKVDENLSDATEWNDPQYVASPIVKAAKPAAEDKPATEKAVHKSSYPLNEYLLARGFASVFAGGIGTRGSDGLRITGAPEETESAKEVIEWLHGDRIAYTDRTRKHETKASWCNGNIGMTGRSYLGTLQIAVATTGVAGLKTVVSEAAISSWYDYYREHGLVIAPEDCQGEDLDLLAETCQSNLWDAGSYLKIKPKYDAMQKDLLTKEDRTTGQYSDYWEARNYRHHTDGIKCSWISVHGLNDWNVKPKNVYKIWQKVKNLPIKHHLFLHQGPHYNMNNLVSIDFTDLMNLWFVHELLGLKNNADKQWPTVMIQDNLEADKWHEEKDWADDLGQEVVYYPTDSQELTKDGNGKEKQSFTDVGGKEFTAAIISESDWQYKFICGDEKWSKPSLRFTTDEFIHPVTIVGRPEVKVRVAGSLPKGQLSVALVELGDRKRLTATPKFLMRGGQELGYRFGTDTLQEFMPDKLTKAKLITKAHMNLQNYQDMKKPSKLEAGQFVDLTFKLQPTYYTIPSGSSLALIIYSTDQGMTKRPLEDETYTIDLAQTEIKFYQK
ncbi:Xaa-Pro dipeptidyl-peptidase [Lactobacillus xujianguonis]|uniref:Xaa-Pro dipeptidyl-peptidase n=1 Tax=Lactobacillus xujianguonis TaxID=2495899 RepID=A0A437SXM4_9LACO|nr:Xaa-Pro dipeptidyl-peptidase [Lactobacillus xujianguonis]RVU71671.1 Xaa-Pro dipeptidyl-peptidase [Lactobacillus xujianguonis]RVU77678.1 Xaa-Pro dipeptidyl-peptidase [Lactobacillus xujianguonis]